MKKFEDHGTCQDRRKPRKAGREGVVTVLTQQNIDDVSPCANFNPCLPEYSGSRPT